MYFCSAFLCILSRLDIFFKEFDVFRTLNNESTRVGYLREITAQLGTYFHMHECNAMIGYTDTLNLLREMIPALHRRYLDMVNSSYLSAELRRSIPKEFVNIYGLFCKLSWMHSKYNHLAMLLIPFKDTEYDPSFLWNKIDGNENIVDTIRSESRLFLTDIIHEKLSYHFVAPKNSHEDHFMSTNDIAKLLPYVKWD